MEMRLGCSLDLAREPENRYDRNAIMVIFEGRQIGYVPREHNLVLSKLMDTAVFDVCAEISLVRFHADPWEKVEMIIYVMNRNRG